MYLFYNLSLIFIIEFNYIEIIKKSQFKILLELSVHIRKIEKYCILGNINKKQIILSLYFFKSYFLYCYYEN